MWISWENSGSSELPRTKSGLLNIKTQPPWCTLQVVCTAFCFMSTLLGWCKVVRVLSRQQDNLVRWPKRILDPIPRHTQPETRCNPPRHQHFHLPGFFRRSDVIHLDLMKHLTQNDGQSHVSHVPGLCKLTRMKQQPHLELGHKSIISWSHSSLAVFF